FANTPVAVQELRSPQDLHLFQPVLEYLPGDRSPPRSEPRCRLVWLASTRLAPTSGGLAINGDSCPGPSSRCGISVFRIIALLLWRLMIRNTKMPQRDDGPG